MRRGCGRLVLGELLLFFFFFSTFVLWSTSCFRRDSLLSSSSSSIGAQNPTAAVRESRKLLSWVSSDDKESFLRLTRSERVKRMRERSLKRGKEQLHLHTKHDQLKDVLMRFGGEGIVCVHGNVVFGYLENVRYECICHEGWSGMQCDVDAIPSCDRSMHCGDIVSNKVRHNHKNKLMSISNCDCALQCVDYLQKAARKIGVKNDPYLESAAEKRHKIVCADKTEEHNFFAYIVADAIVDYSKRNSAKVSISRGEALGIITDLPPLNERDLNICEVGCSGSGKCLHYECSCEEEKYGQFCQFDKEIMDRKREELMSNVREEKNNATLSIAILPLAGYLKRFNLGRYNDFGVHGSIHHAWDSIIRDLDVQTVVLHNDVRSVKESTILLVPLSPVDGYGAVGQDEFFEIERVFQLVRRSGKFDINSNGSKITPYVLWFDDRDRGMCTDINGVHNFRNIRTTKDIAITLHGGWRSGSMKACFDPEKDIVIPSGIDSVNNFQNIADPYLGKTDPEFTRFDEKTKTGPLLYFRGTTKPDSKCSGELYFTNWGYCINTYAQGARAWIAETYSKTNSFWINKEDIPTGGKEHFEFMSKSKFCLVSGGGGFDSRLLESVIRGCVPLLTQNNVSLPFEMVLDYSKFSIHANHDSLKRLPKILTKAVVSGRYREMLANLRMVREAFASNAYMKEGVNDDSRTFTIKNGAHSHLMFAIALRTSTILPAPIVEDLCKLYYKNPYKVDAYEILLPEPQSMLRRPCEVNSTESKSKTHDVDRLKEEMDDDRSVQDLAENGQELYDQIYEDLEPFQNLGGISLEMTEKALSSYTIQQRQGFGFAWFNKNLWYITQKPSQKLHGHHYRLFYTYLRDFCAVFNDTEAKDIPPFEVAVSTEDYNKPHRFPKFLPVLCYNKYEGDENGCILHPGFGFRFRDIDEKIYDKMDKFDSLYPWREKRETLFGRFSPYSREGPHSKTRERKVFVEYSKNFTDLMDVVTEGKLRSPLDQMKYKYILHLDGVAHSFQLEEKLGMNSVVFSEKILFQTYFSKLLSPYRDFMTFWNRENDDSPEDIQSGLKYAKTHDERMRRIARNGNAFARKFLVKASRNAYYKELFRSLSKLLKYEITQRKGALRVCCDGNCGKDDLDVNIDMWKPQEESEEEKPEESIKPRVSPEAAQKNDDNVEKSIDSVEGDRPDPLPWIISRSLNNANASQIWCSSSDGNNCELRWERKISDSCCTPLETIEEDRKGEKVVIPQGFRAREKWGCQDSSCHPDRGVHAEPVYDFDVSESFDEWRKEPSHSRFAVCIAGQIRSLKRRFVLDNFKVALSYRVHPDIFMQISSEERDRFYHSAGAADVHYIMHKLKPVHVRLASDTDLELEMMENDRERKRGYIGTRWRSCLARMQEAEEKRGEKYEWIFRLRPDMLWPCILPRNSKWPNVNDRKLVYFASNEAAVATRTALEPLLDMNMKREEESEEYLIEGQNLRTQTPYLVSYIIKKNVTVMEWPKPPSMLLDCSVSYNVCEFERVKKVYEMKQECDALEIKIESDLAHLDGTLT